jgi:S1-C subfamily serine protease
MYGRVIGINTLVAGQAEAGVQSQGIGFAISINQAKQIAAQLVKDGKIDHAFLGISYQPLTPAIAKQFNLDISQGGAAIMQITNGSPAAQAGLVAGDVITSIDGTKITSESLLGQIISQHKAGDKIKLEVVNKNSQTRTIEVTLASKVAA